MKNLMNALQTLWADESGQGATEYILLLVVVVAIGILFRKQITNAVSSRLSDISGAMGKFTTGG